MPSYSKRIPASIRAIYGKFFAPKEDEETIQILNTLQNVDLFNPLTRRQLLGLAPAFHRRHYKRDEVIYYQGDPGLGLYVVESGSVTLAFEEGTGDVYDAITLGPNQTFGIVSTYGDIRRQETARAVTQTSVLGLFAPELKSVIRRKPALGAAVLLLLVQHIAEFHVSFVERLSASTDSATVLDTLMEIEAKAASGSVSSQN